MMFVLIKNNFFICIILSVSLIFVSCKYVTHNYDAKKNQILKSDSYNVTKMPVPKAKKPLYIEITLDSIITEKEYPQYFDEWDNYEFNYYYLKLNLINHGSYLFKIHLTGYKMPIIFQFGKNKDETIYLNEIQQLNTVWQDSIVFKKDIQGKYNPHKAYQIGFYHNGIDNICLLDIVNNRDTIDITNLNNKEKFFQRQRKEIQ